MGFWAVSNMRTILEGETDADSPGSEELASQFRENHEALTLLTYATGSTGTVTSIAGASSSTLNDSSAAYSVDQHNSRTLLITGTTGSATGNMYQITDTTATTLVCGSSDLGSVAASDTYVILHDMTNTDGHDHDGVNSPPVVLQNSQVIQAKIKTTTAEYSENLAPATGTLKTGVVDYAFWPDDKNDNGVRNHQIGLEGTRTNGSYVRHVWLENLESSTYTFYVYARFRYVESS